MKVVSGHGAPGVKDGELPKRPVKEVRRSRKDRRTLLSISMFAPAHALCFHIEMNSMQGLKVRDLVGLCLWLYPVMLSQGHLGKGVVPQDLGDGSLNKLA